MEKLYTLPETAEILRCSVPTIRRFIKKGSLKAFKSGGVLLVSESALKNYLQSVVVSTINENTTTEPEESA